MRTALTTLILITSLVPTWAAVQPLYHCSVTGSDGFGHSCCGSADASADGADAADLPSCCGSCEELDVPAPAGVASPIGAASRPAHLSTVSSASSASSVSSESSASCSCCEIRFLKLVSVIPSRDDGIATQLTFVPVPTVAPQHLLPLAAPEIVTAHVLDPGRAPPPPDDPLPIRHAALRV